MKKFKEKIKTIANHKITVKDLVVIISLAIVPGSLIGLSAYMVLKNFKKKEVKDE